jgi:hypothetical protein
MLRTRVHTSFAAGLAALGVLLGVEGAAHAQDPRRTSDTDEPAGDTTGAGDGTGDGADDDAQPESPTSLPEDVALLPHGPTIPDLQHTAAEATFEQTIASVTPNGGGSLEAQLFKADVEVPLVRHTLYVGGHWAFAAARSPAQHDARFVSGQPEVFGRIARGSPDEGYAFGAGLGLLPPLFVYDDLDDGQRLKTTTTSALVGIVRPWDLTTFFDRRVTSRPWIDLRIGRNRFIAQIRQELDFALRTGAPATGSFGDHVGDLEIVSVTALYFGWRPTDQIALGCEAWEVHLLKTNMPVSDRDRTVFTLSPGIRFFERWIEPGASLLIPFGAPLLGAVDNYVALRLDMRVWLE